MSESRLQRWSRQKNAARKAEELSPPSTDGVEFEPAPEERELAINETLPEHEVLAKYDLPDPTAITLGTDVTGFMRKEIPELLRRKALRALWRSNPVLAVLDGLNDYDQDFSNTATPATGLKTLYKVGEGFIGKRVREDDAPSNEGIEEPAMRPESAAPAKVAHRPVPETAPEPPSQPELPEPEVLQPEEQLSPRYRPRMRFE